ncbi:TRAP transporter small permease subunit [Colwellia sp. MSW7]|uniref:TRAP transporter small permease protein n=1 Tax=Colwellia maritima TaxID=2912588 RepID=A0ABS9WX64_9GAMM|nr:TRAP transporter small permease subunit [Colwellia maritima]MCI2282568.1 TRAP transporter small permease subunit [Colwellia maritima]
MNASLKLITKIIDALGNLCSLLMLLMIANVFYDVIMRYFFNDVNIGMQELEWHLFAAMFMFGIAYTLKEDAHVRVDIFYDAMTPKKQALINIFGSLLFALPITLLILYYGYGYALEAYTIGEGSGDPGGLPHRWIVRAVIPLSSFLLVLSIFHVVLSNILILRGIIVPEKHHQGEV